MSAGATPRIKGSVGFANDETHRDNAIPRASFGSASAREQSTGFGTTSSKAAFRSKSSFSSTSRLRSNLAADLMRELDLPSPRTVARAEAAAKETHRRLAELGVAGPQPLQPLLRHRADDSTDWERSAGLPPLPANTSSPTTGSSPRARRSIMRLPPAYMAPSAQQQPAMEFFGPPVPSSAFVLPSMFDQSGPNLLLKQAKMLPPSETFANALYDLKPLCDERFASAPGLTPSMTLPELRSGNAQRVADGTARLPRGQAPGLYRNPGRPRPGQKQFGRPPAQPIIGVMRPLSSSRSRSYGGLPPTELTDRITRLREQNAALSAQHAAIGAFVKDASQGVTQRVSPRSGRSPPRAGSMLTSASAPTLIATEWRMAKFGNDEGDWRAESIGA
uniref:Uncharacterized protein n=1 Tax=Haptolina brevifila TaxID=156173 RepID=A0A7S2JPG8_9EUKA